MMNLHTIILPVALLLCCAGCGGKKKARKKAVPVSNITHVHNQAVSRDALIIRTTQKVVREKGEQKEPQQSAIVSQGAHIRKPHFLERLAEIEARLGEIPVPLMAQALDAVGNRKGGYAMVYETKLSREELTSFYQEQMLRLGWTLVSAFETEDAFFSFRKNKQFCTIFIRPVTGWWKSIKAYRLHLYIQV